METTVALRELDASELGAAAALLGRGMRDNPLHVAAFGTDPARREAALSRFFVPVLRRIPSNGRVLGAFRGPTLLEVCAMTRPGRCQPTLAEKLRIVPAIVLGNPTRTLRAVLTWTRAWAKRDPSAAHWHLGPVAVERETQRQGIGGHLLSAFCRSMDELDGLAYLETDKRENADFYRKHGFVETGQASVLGVPSWYMERRR